MPWLPIEKEAIRGAKGGSFSRRNEASLFFLSPTEKNLMNRSQEREEKSFFNVPPIGRREPVKGCGNEARVF